MKLVRTRADVRAASDSARREGDRIVLVPTMGALHRGHLSLVERASELGDFVVMSIFVNPLQFDRPEDLACYPSDLERDLAAAESTGVSLVFAPAVEELYGSGGQDTLVEPGALGQRLEGAFRPGHFQGVLTVVVKLLNIVQPHAAVFGRKDYQQAALIRQMVRDLDLPLEIEVAPTVREEDGLALSSRNVLLSEEARVQARSLSRGLFSARADFIAGANDPTRLEAAVRDEVGAQPLAELEYVQVVDGVTMLPVAKAREGDVIVVAATVGDVRLIDNVILSADVDL